MKDNTFKIYFQNVRGLNTKTHIRSDITAAKFHMISLVETWLQDNFNSSELFDDSFVVYRSDGDLESTEKKTGGGCLVALKNNIWCVYSACCNSFCANWCGFGYHECLLYA